MRLIDADALLEQYNLKDATKYGNKNAEQQAHSYSTLMLYEIADMIEDAPTAYDIDKVVDEFDKKYNNSLWIKGNEEFSITRNELIEIVNQCGVSDDVCEWREHPICGFYSEHIGADRIINIDEYKYCPYCGKKIKVVE